jgi:hypothetical protein
MAAQPAFEMHPQVMSPGQRRELRLGPDRTGNLLEIVVLLLDDGTEVIIHAMRTRPRYRGLLP